jgi:hypothetical protein
MARALPSASARLGPRHATLVAGALVLAVGCAPAATRIVVVADSDLAVPGAIDRIRFEVDSRALGGELAQREADLLTPSTALPVVMPIVHEGGRTGPLTVRAVAMLGDQEIVERTARLSFVLGRSLVLRLDLNGACVGVECGGGETCGSASGCVSSEVDPASLPEYVDPSSADRLDAGLVPRPDARAAPPDAASPDGGRLADGGVADGGAVDGGAGPPDAGSLCTSGCACLQSCDDGRCECRDLCTCRLDCSPSGDCEEVICDRATCTVVAPLASNLSVRCDHEASCTVDARGASNALGLTCRNESTCDIDCTDVSNCALECDDSSRAVLRCAGTSSCELRCSGTRTECAGDVVVCNRACP